MLYKRNSDRLLSYSILSIAFYQQKVSIREILKQFGVRANKIYQSDFLRVAVLNYSTKGTMTGSFCRAHFP